MFEKKKTLNDGLPVFEVADSLLIFKDGRVGIGFEIQPLEMEKYPANSYTHLCEMFSSACKTLPVGATVQKLDFYYYKPFQYASGQSFFERNMINHFYNRLALLHKSYLFLSIGHIKQKLPNAFNSLFAWGKAFMMAQPFEGIEERLETLPRLGDEFVSILSSAGVGARRLNDAALKEVYRMYFNLEFDSVPATLERPLCPEQNYAVLGEKKVNVISMINQPGEVNPAVGNLSYQKGFVASPFIYPLTHYLQMPHILSVNCTIQDTEERLKSLDKENRNNKWMEFLATQDNLKKSEEISSFTHEIRTYNQKLVDTSLTLITWETDDQLRQQYVAQALKAFQLMGGATAMTQTVDTANLYVANAPGNSFHNYRKLLTTTDNASMYQNFITNYEQITKGDELLCDRSGNPLRIRLFNTDLNNQNSVTIGPSGSGKSYTMGNLILQRYEMGHRQIIIDVGGTYLSLVTALGGSYFEYDPEAPLNLNPFLVDRDTSGKYILSGDKANFLTALLAIMWKDGITKAERSIFSKMLTRYYKYYNSCLTENPALAPPGISGFYDWVEAFEKEASPDYLRLVRSFDFNEFLIVLEPYAHGQYKDVLNSPTHSDISEGKLICFDMIKIKKNPLLYPVICLLITELGLDIVRKYPNDRKYFYMDEAWSMLSEGMGEFVQDMYRTVRKNNGSMCIITQGIGEILKSSVGAAILINADTYVILNHSDAQEVEHLAQALGLTDHEKQLIHSIRKGKTYRELFIKQGDYAKIYMMEVALSVDAILTSKPKERNYLRYLQATRKDIKAAIAQYTETKLTGGSMEIPLDFQLEKKEAEQSLQAEQLLQLEQTVQGEPEKTDIPSERNDIPSGWVEQVLADTLNSQEVNYE